ncbi:oligopeptide transport system substrate-binding protein [Sinobacterium caligoides]|uniref:Oligopeptide transport system substrate-binding protein n=2 Tax=Sinobacterium caligoides TaxID=933926 RepID=A0A3N2DP44_9GAMM|nr:oligopeptide transport system substrate-binding protein [Sinobacterium caligoides]
MLWKTLPLRLQRPGRLRALVGRSALASLFSLAILLAPSQASAQGAVNEKTQTLTLALTSEPPSASTLLGTDQVSFWLIDHITEGLMGYDKNNALTGAIAKRWELRDDGATFWLRKDAKWSDGSPVTAHDFVFAWREVLKPATASEYAFILYPIKNAEAVNKGELSSDQLGVRAVGDYRLEVTFTQPCAYFLDLTAFISYRPVKEEFFKQYGRAYASDPDKMLYNGPFVLTKWVHGASLNMKKNEHYWNKEVVKLQEIDVPYITSDTSALYNLFKDGEIAMKVVPGIGPDTIKKALADHLPMRKFNDGSNFYMEFNHRPDRLTSNRNLRKAIQLVFDQQLFTNKVVASPGNKPSYSLFPDWVRGAEQPLYKEYPPKFPANDEKLAREYLEKAKQELGLEQIPPLILLSTDSPGANKQSEYVQSLLKRTLGLDIKIDKQIFKQRLAKMGTGEFDLVGSGWGPDFNDAMTFAELFASWNKNNRGRYSNPEYDRLVRLAQSTTDPKTRAHAFGELQQLLIDDAAIINQYQRGYVYLQNTHLRGVVRRIFGGDPVFKYAYIEEEQEK